MNNIINKFYNIVDKIGKRNIILIIFLLIVIIVAGLYTTFSLYTTTDGTSLVDGLMTYKFILNNSNVESSVTIASGSSKNIAITISNPESISLKYGLYYSSTDDISSVNIGYLSTSSKLPKDTIPGNNDYTVTIKIDNTSSNSVTIKFGIVYGLENGGELNLPSGKSWLDEYVDIILLNTVEVGSYVSYTGNNGCSGNSCSGQNANYVSDTDMGYCYSSSNKFTVNGWRVGYISDDTTYLVSAGAVECSESEVAEVSVGAYLYSDSVTFDAGNFTLGDTTSYTWPTDNTSMLNKYTCKSSTSNTCTTLYYVSSVSQTNLELKPINVTADTNASNITGSSTSYMGTNYMWSSTKNVPVVIESDTPKFSVNGSTTQPTEAGYYTIKSTTSGTNSVVYHSTNVTTRSNGFYYTTYTYTVTGYTLAFGTSETYSNENTTSASEFILGLNNIASKYCNTNYAYEGICDSSSVWSINGTDFAKMNNNTELTAGATSSDSIELISNGGYYWLNDGNNLFNWNPTNSLIQSTTDVSLNYGIRPVLKLSKNILVNSGSGTYKDPYVISAQ